MKASRQTYEQHADRLAKVIDIGYRIISESEIPLEDKARLLRMCKLDKESALNPAPIYKRVGSLRCIESEHFYYWNETQGAHIEKFWLELKRNGTQYERKDIFKSVLKRNRINNRQEYDYIIDEMLVAEVNKRITMEEYKKLNEMLLVYEKKHTKNN